MIKWKVIILTQLYNFTAHFIKRAKIAMVMLKLCNFAIIELNQILFLKKRRWKYWTNV